MPGIGEKTAVKLLNEYGTLEGIYENIDRISGRVKEKLIAGKERAFLSYQLSQIMFDAPVKLVEVPDFVLDPERVKRGLRELEFNSLIRKFGLGKSSNNNKSSKGFSNADLKNSKTNKGFSNTDLKKQNVIPLVNGRDIHFASSNPGNVLEKPLSDSNQDLILSWDVKELMHEDEGVAEQILGGAEFWDLGQGAFLLNPLAREIEKGDEGVEYERQTREFLQRSDLYKIFVQFDLPLVPILYKMEKRGMLIDREYFKKLQLEIEQEVAEKEKEIWELAGVTFNVNSPVQLAGVLYEKLGLPTKGIKKTQRGYSTGARELEKLKRLHPIIPKLMEYRELAKLLSTYILPIPELADAEGRVHTTFTQNVTATGRLSSLNPNLQNIPVRTELGQQIRRGFVAPAGKKLVSADYSQFELRLAGIVGDEKLVEDFNRGVDIHTKTAAEAFKVPFNR